MSSSSGERRARTISGEVAIAPWQRAVQKLQDVLGANKTSQLVEATLRHIQLKRIETLDELLRFGEALLVHGGVIEAIGRSIKIQALLHGAQKTPPPAQR